MKDSVTKSAVVGRVGAGVAALVAVVTGLLGYTVEAAETEELIENGYAVFMAGSGFVSAGLAWWSKIKESKK